MVVLVVRVIVVFLLFMTTMCLVGVKKLFHLKVLKAISQFVLVNVLCCDFDNS